MSAAPSPGSLRTPQFPSSDPQAHDDDVPPGFEQPVPGSGTEADEEPSDPWAQARNPSFDPAEFRQFLNFVEAQRAAQTENTRSPEYEPRRPGRRNYREDQESDGEQERSNAGPPPSYDGVTDFKDYFIRAKLWLSTTKSKPRTRGPLLLKNLTGSAFDNFKYLAKDDRWLSSSTNGDDLLKMMNTREYYGEDSREDMLNCLGKLTYQLRRSKSESHRDFWARWENAVRKVREHGVVLPPEYLGFLFIMALQLSPEEVKLLMNFSKGSLHVTDVKEWLRVHETELDFKVNSKEVSKNLDKKAVYFMGQPEDEQSETIDDEDYQDYEVLLAAAEELGVSSESTEEVFDEDDAKEILATMVRDHSKGFGKG